MRAVGSLRIKLLPILLLFDQETGNGTGSLSSCTTRNMLSLLLRVVFHEHSMSQGTRQSCGRKTARTRKRENESREETEIVTLQSEGATKNAKSRGEFDQRKEAAEDLSSRATWTTRRRADGFRQGKGCLQSDSTAARTKPFVEALVRNRDCRKSKVTNFLGRDSTNWASEVAGCGGVAYDQCSMVR